MQSYITELEKERTRLWRLLTPEQMRIAYPDPEEWIVDNEMNVVKPPEGKAWTKCITDGCPNGRLVQGLCASCVGKELVRLREEYELWRRTEKEWYAEKVQLNIGLVRLQDEIDALLARDIPELQEGLAELRQDVTAKIEAYQDAEREIKRLRSMVKTQGKLLTGPSSELTRLRGIEVAGKRMKRDSLIEQQANVLLDKLYEQMAFRGPLADEVWAVEQIGNALCEAVESREVHTMIECANPACKRGVRPRFAICGLCNACAETRLEQLQYAVKFWLKEEEDWKAEEKRLRGINDEIAVLRMENAQVYAMMECMGEELDRMKLIIKRLRGIEEACINVYGDKNSREAAVIFWHARARETHGIKAGHVIADALEAK